MEGKGDSKIQLQTILTQRFLELKHLMSIFTGTGLYYQTVKIPISDLSQLYQTKSKKTEQLFSFGLSLGSLERMECNEFVKAIDNLTSQYESQYGDTRVIGKPTKNKSTMNELGDSNLLGKTTVPFQLDFLKVALALIDILLICYAKMIPNEQSTSEYCELVLRIDKQIWKSIVLPIMKEVDMLASSALANEFVFI
jgi:hypothetical protein